MVSKKYGKFSLNFDRFIKAKTQEIIEAINEALEHIQQRINEKTPEDTGDLVDHNVIVKAVEKDGVITGSVKNSLGYAIYVEYGRSKTEWVPKIWVKYKYNKPKGTIFYEGVGARMFTRTADEERAFIINLITTRVIWRR